MSFLAPLAFLGALIAIPILLLYMLRLRRREVLISSTFLWRQIVQDKEANTPWQRLRRNLLLLLQLLILALLVLALARPFITVPTFGGQQTALLIDATASMNAIDETDGLSRFEMAKRRALEVIDTLSAGSVVTVIRVGTLPEVAASYTSDRTQLQAAINQLQPGTGEGDWLAALTLAAAGGANAEEFNIVIISDGGLGEETNLPAIAIPGEIRLIAVGQSADNIAISALAARNLPGEPPQLFAQLTNYGAVDAEVIFSLRVDDDPIPLVSERYVVPANGMQSIVSTDALNQAFEVLQAEITLSVNNQANDYLSLDNQAWSITRDSGDRTVLVVTAGNLFLEQVLRSIPGVTFFTAEPGSPLPTQTYDLYIFDNTLPIDAELPNSDMLIINPPSSTALFTLGAESDQTENIQLAAGDERLAFVDFTNVNILKFRPIEAIGAWGTPLITAQGGTLLLAGETAGKQIAVLPFNLRDSDLPLQITYPILMTNLLNWFTPSEVLVSDGTLNIGDEVVIRPPLEANIMRITMPSGVVQDYTIERNTLIFSETDAPGIYTLEVFNNSELLQAETFAVNLFSPSESNIAPRTVTIGGTVISAEIEEELGQREFWNWIALAALLMLLIEWYVYHRQLQIPTLLNPSRQVVRPRRV
ncbi:MAG: VWA domain-containing protein [Anaerolineae bacterium]|jgi:hypothetical protein|nr:VWA domain-containing protein [Anaerolineae bacterium]